MTSAAESRRPKPGRAQRTREALLRAGRQLFSERPVDAVAIDDIVQAADVAKGSFYNHFADREALVRAVVAEIRASIETAIGEANAGVEDPARRMARANSVYLRFALDDPQRARALVRIQTGLINLQSPVNRGLVDDIRAGLASGRFAIATLEAAALFVMGVMQAAVARTAAEPSKSAAVGLAQQMNALILQGLGVPGAEAQAIAAQAADELIGAG
ncbi:MAG: TetR family transcriptional regulator [Phenylobacterium sp.]|uniref:TetR/AcrR family transcriptional regulator n=1 Tax=Phenylobacterium sp. TaxID=1871053 RepID=UPI0026004769|nr:TetR/AcrR family transcriptional regulator [Phenylobacterium sp.]MBI1197030.1 TetR family transcriptional regulator [Phenylobacterium sp.]